MERYEAGELEKEIMKHIAGPVRDPGLLFSEPVKKCVPLCMNVFRLYLCICGISTFMCCVFICVFVYMWVCVKSLVVSHSCSLDGL